MAWLARPIPTSLTGRLRSSPSSVLKTLHILWMLISKFGGWPNPVGSSMVGMRCMTRCKSSISCMHLGVCYLWQACHLLSPGLYLVGGILLCESPWAKSNSFIGVMISHKQKYECIGFNLLISSCSGFISSTPFTRCFLSHWGGIRIVVLKWKVTALGASSTNHTCLMSGEVAFSCWMKSWLIARVCIAINKWSPCMCDAFY